MQFEILTTERLILRKITPEIVVLLFTSYTEEEIMHYLGLKNKEEFMKEKEKFKKGLRTYNKTFLYFQVMDKTTEKIIGWSGYHTWYLDHNRAEIGYGLFNEEVKNKGLMTEALKPIIAYGFYTMHLTRIEAMLSLENIPSLKLVTKFGFQQEGVLKDHYLKDGVMEDSAIYGLLKLDY